MNQPDALPPLALTMGEPAGIGSEVLLKAYAAAREEPLPTHPFFVIDDPARLSKQARTLGTDFPCTSISAPSEAAEAFRYGLPVLPLRDPSAANVRSSVPGEPSHETASAVVGSIDEAVGYALSGAASGVVTLPIQKAILQESGYTFAGHTDYLGTLTKDTPMPAGQTRGPVMMLAAGGFRAVPATIHVPLASVPSLLSPDLLIEVADVLADALRLHFAIAAPRLAFSGLNPHAGEDGHMGQEEISIIAPAIASLRRRGMNVSGPFPGDTLFHPEARAHYDAVIAMYHDQALIPIKTVAFHDAVNVTLGLPIIRTSPDHGTGLPIAGRGIARPDSTIAAIKMASQMAKARAAHGA